MGERENGNHKSPTEGKNDRRKEVLSSEENYQKTNNRIVKVIAH